MPTSGNLIFSICVPSSAFIATNPEAFQSNDCELIPFFIILGCLTWASSPLHTLEEMELYLVWDAESEISKENTLLTSRLTVNDDEDSDAPVAKKKQKKSKKRAETSSESEEDSSSSAEEDRAPTS